jgi:hypothetical protein
MSTAKPPPPDHGPAHGGPDGRCEATTKAGKPCHLRAEPGTARCVLHTAGEARRALLAARGRAGQAKRTARRRAARAAVARAVSLATAAEIRAALEAALGRVEASDASAVAKCHATARVCAVALAVLDSVALRAELDDLREALCDRVPGLRTRLGLPAHPGAELPS